MDLPLPVIDLVRGRTVGYFATSANGFPHVTPVWLDWEPELGVVLVDVEIETKKLSNVTRNPRVALSFVDPENEANWVTLQGRVEQIVQDDGASHLQAVARRYLGRAKRRPGRRRVLFVRPVLVRWWGDK